MIPEDGRLPYGDEHRQFRDSVRRLFERELAPNADRWEREGIMSREFWRVCGEAGLLCPQTPGEYDGLGLGPACRARPPSPH